MARRLFETVFIALAVLLVILVGLLNCLQGTPFLGGSRCNLDYTSSDFLIKAIATGVFLLFVALILGPVAAAFLETLRGKEKKQPQTEDREKPKTEVREQ
jgi:hypothetical protein